MIKLLESKETRRFFVMLLVALMLVGVTAVAYALVAVVDGDDTGDWGTNPTTCTIGNAGCSRIVDDGVARDVTPVTDYYDIKSIFMTNDDTYLYFRIDFWGSSTSLTEDTWFATGGGTTPELNICIDIDNNDTTGPAVNSGICDGDETMAGTDRRIRIMPSLVTFGQPLNPEVHTCTNAFCVNQTGSGTIGYDSAFVLGGDTDAITEVRVPLADLGISGPTCPGGGAQPCIIELGFYYDNGTAPQDDSIPDVGFITGEVGSGSPTAVSLQNVSASGQSAVLPFALGAFGLIVVGTGLVIKGKRKTVQ